MKIKEYEWAGMFNPEFIVNIGDSSYLETKFGNVWHQENLVSDIGSLPDEYLDKATKVNFWGRSEDETLNHLTVLRMIFPTQLLFLWFPNNTHIRASYYAQKPQ